MKIEKFECAHWMCHSRLNVPFSPVTIIGSDHNGAGKSAIGDAIAFAMLGEIRRITEKGDRDQLLQDGAAGAGFVGIHTSWGSIRRDIKTGKTIAEGTSIAPPAELVSGTVQFALDPERFERLAPDARKDALLAIMRVHRKPKAIIEELAERGHSADLLSRMPIEQPFVEWEGAANMAATEARGAWKGITKENYGSKKAEIWAPPAVEAPDSNAVASAEKSVADCRQKIEDIVGEIATMRANAILLERRTQLETDAKFLDPARDNAATKARELAEADASLTKATADLAAIRARLHSAQGLPCPHCEALIEIKKGEDQRLTLAIHSPPANPASNADLHAAHAASVRATNLQREAAAADTAAKTALSTAMTAHEELKKFPTVNGSPESLALKEQALADARRSLSESEKALAEIRAREKAADAATKARDDARALHKEVVAALKLAADLSPSGMPSDWLTKALDTFNKTLRQMAEFSGWRQVAVRADMQITSDGRNHELTSRGQRWRTNAMIAVAIAHFAGTKFVMLDDFDVLQVNDRMPALKWLHQVTSTGLIDSAVVFATLKQRPAVPPSIGLFWLADQDSEDRAAA